MPHATRPGDVLAGRYRLTVLLHERSGGRFWRAFDQVLARDVALHLIADDDPRADQLRDAARRSATLHDPHLLRVLDTDTVDGACYVVNEWGEGISLNHLVAEAPLGPRRAAWITAEAGEMIAAAHAAGLAHGRLVPENVLVDQTGSVKIIGFAVDAALHGLPPGDPADDVTDLAGILYSALTGKWAGHSFSGLPEAPRDNGHAMRPRQVRAGVPRVLDTLCDEVLGSASPSQAYPSARAVVDALLEYVGDPASVAAAEAALMRDRTPVRSSRLPPVMAPPPVPAAEDLPGDETVAMPVPDVTQARATGEQATGEQATEESDATQAAVPVFDDGVLDWPAPREDPPPPPPPFEEPQAKPLFAPDPPPGEPVRRPRHPQPADTGSGSYWPWEDEDTGTPVVVREPEPREPVPGRNWLRIAAVIAVCLVLLLAAVYAFNRGRDGVGLLDRGSDDPTATADPPRPVEIVSASDFDPPPGDGEENGDTVGQAVDGDPETTWRTLTYRQDMGPGGLKEGVGLVLDLGSPTDVRQVRLTLVGGPTTVELYGTDAPPADMSGLERVAEATSDGSTLVLTPDTSLSTRYLLLWITGMPSVEGGQFRAEIAEVEVRG